MSWTFIPSLIGCMLLMFGVVLTAALSSVIAIRRELRRQGRI